MMIELDCLRDGNASGWSWKSVCLARIKLETSSIYTYNNRVGGGCSVVFFLFYLIELVQPRALGCDPGRARVVTRS